MPTLPVIKQPTVVTSAMRLIGSVERSRQTQHNASLLVSIPTTVIKGLLPHESPKTL
jgi:hypothetical protein